MCVLAPAKGTREREVVIGGVYLVDIVHLSIWLKQRAKYRP